MSWSSVACVVVLSSLAAPALAAPCDRGFPLKQGTVVELTRYNDAHQPIGRVVATIVSSVVKGESVTAVERVDNWVGANQTGSNTVELSCDGKAVSMNLRNGDAMNDFLSKASVAAEKNRIKVKSATTVSQPQTYPLDLKVGDELPSYRAFSLMVIQKAPPDWGKVAATGNWMAALNYALDNKFAGGVQMVTTHIKVAAAESCKIPDGSSAPCFRITKELFSRPLAGKADVTRDVSEMAKGAPLQNITEWFAPGVGIVKLEISMAGRPGVSMAMTALKR